jgi:hypothetical protein
MTLAIPWPLTTAICLTLVEWSGPRLHVPPTAG